MNTLDRESRPNAGRGFTVIEAIVALSIIGLALIPIFTFLSQASLQLRLADDSNARSLATQDIVAYLESVNPMTQGEGTESIGSLSFSWTSKPLVPPNDQIRPGTGLAAFSVGFYDVTVQVSRSGGGSWFDFNLRKVGYQRFPQDGLSVP